MDSGVVGSGTGGTLASAPARLATVTRPAAASTWQTMTSGLVEPVELSRVSSVP